MQHCCGWTCLEFGCTSRKVWLWEKQQSQTTKLKENPPDLWCSIQEHLKTALMNHSRRVLPAVMTLAACWRSTSRCRCWAGSRCIRGCVRTKTRESRHKIFCHIMSSVFNSFADSVTGASSLLSPQRGVQQNAHDVTAVLHRDVLCHAALLMHEGMCCFCQFQHETSNSRSRAFWRH